VKIFLYFLTYLIVGHPDSYLKGIGDPFYGGKAAGA